MLFWILLAVTAFFMWKACTDYYLGYGIGLILVPFLGALVGLLVLGIGTLSAPSSYYKHTGDTTVDLRSMGSGDSVSGRSYFLGGGYVEGKKVLSYISAESDGASVLRSVNADQSRVYEDTDKPTVTIKSFDKHIWWLAPFPTDSTKNYVFHVPKGTVSDSFTMTP